jgi:hypothetical protein
MKLLLAGVLAATLFSAAPASADPGTQYDFRNTTLCGDHGAVHDCPGGGFVSAFSGYCPGLVNGLTPPLPGGLPSDGSQ